MNNHTTDLYEKKRDIVNFSKKIAKGLNKSKQKFIMDMQYGIARSNSCLISNISRGLNENIKINHTIERLCDNLNNFSDLDIEIIKNNYIKEMEKLFPDEPIVLFDDTDIAKKYGKKFEDLDKIIDGSSLTKEVVNGYNVCETLILTEKKNNRLMCIVKFIHV